jgi:hypothetical protein
MTFSSGQHENQLLQLFLLTLNLTLNTKFLCIFRKITHTWMYNYHQRSPTRTKDQKGQCCAMIRNYIPLIPRWKTGLRETEINLLREQCCRERHTHTRHTETFITCASAWTSCIWQEKGMHFQNQTCAGLCQIKCIKTSETHRKLFPFMLPNYSTIHIISTRCQLIKLN